MNPTGYSAASPAAPRMTSRVERWPALCDRAGDLHDQVT
jgi:hypothetical protein